MFENNNDDYKSEIEMWADMWDQAQEDEIHPAPEAPEPSEFAAGVLGLEDSAQDAYWDYIDTEEQLFQEDNNPNPIHPDSAGPDQESKNTAWVNNDLLKEIESLKDKLFKVENQIAKMGSGDNLEQTPLKSDDNKMMSEVESLRKRIEKVSSSLGIVNEKSPSK